MSRFGPDQTLCQLCVDECRAASVGNDLCAEWLHARSLNVNSAWVWHFSEYAPGKFALYGPGRAVALLTSDWTEVLEHYRNRPAYVPPASTLVHKAQSSGIDLSKLEIKI